MPPRPQISGALRGQIVLLQKQGLSQVKIAKTIKCSRCAVQNTIERFQQTGSYRNLPKGGRKRVTTMREYGLIERTSLRDRHKTAGNIVSELCEQHSTVVSVRTIRRRSAASNLQARRPRRKPLLTDKHRKQRIVWAKKHENWTIDDWAKVIWSDESNVDMYSLSSTRYLRPRKGEAYLPECVMSTVKFGGGSIMIWGCMMSQGLEQVYMCVGPMNNIRYIDVLEQVLEPSTVMIPSTGNTISNKTTPLATQLAK